jgi:heterodisulfide reductase subunit D
VEEVRKKYILPDKADIVYFIGCTSNYRQQSIRDATLSVLKKLEIDYTVVDEYCCGSPLIRTGQVKNISFLMQHNIDVIRQSGAKIVLTSCAGCYRTLSKDFPKYGFDFPPEIKICHTSEYLNNHFKEYDLPEKVSNKSLQITFHDPCHLGRHMGIYDAPRELLAKLPNLRLVEMQRNRDLAWCCGSGGGTKIGYPEWAIEVAYKRIEEAKETGMNTIVSTCPFCKTNLQDANKKYNADMNILDLIEILDEYLP